MKHHRISLFLVGSMLGLVSVGNAQITGYTAELDTAFGDIPSSDPLAELAYHGVYNIYANFTSPEDVLGSLYADVVALGTAPMGIDAPCGCFNPTSSTMLIEGNNSETTIGFFPEFAYDSFWTIGLADFFEEGVEPQLVSVETPNDLCEGFTINDGLIYALGSEATGWPANMIAGDDLKILVARVTTCGDPRNQNLKIITRNHVGRPSSCFTAQRIDKPIIDGESLTQIIGGFDRNELRFHAFLKEICQSNGPKGIVRKFWEEPDCGLRVVPFNKHCRRRGIEASAGCVDAHWSCAQSHHVGVQRSQDILRRREIRIDVVNPVVGQLCQRV